MYCPCGKWVKNKRFYYDKIVYCSEMCIEQQKIKEKSDAVRLTDFNIFQDSSH
jgi:hypothetical protein